MGKFLRVLVILIFLLTAASLTLACLLFTKREILKGRAQKLEQGLIELSRTLEAEPPAIPEEPEAYPARDVSDCSSEILDTPTLSEFWATYKTQLESLDQEVIDLTTQTRDLMSYYKIDPVTMKPARDKLYNLKITTGEGTTQGVIDGVIAKARAQYALLVETRQQLETIRIELIDTINELNGRKITLREKLAVIDDLRNQIAALNNTISELRDEISELKDQIRSLEGVISNLRQEKLVLEETNDGLQNTVKAQSEKIQFLRNKLEKPSSQDSVTKGLTYTTTRIEIGPGVKGTVASVDQKHLFIVMDLEPEFIAELLDVMEDKSLPLIELLVRRGEDTFITKVRMKQLKKEQNLAIGEILPDWQQERIEVGDLIFLQ